MSNYNKTNTPLVGAIFVLLKNVEALALRWWRIDDLEPSNIFLSLGNIFTLLFLGLFGSLGCWLFARWMELD
jgi:hypothetical protein